jgi:hypothetical protein
MSNGQYLSATLDLIKALTWPTVVVWAVWYWRDELKAAAKRVTEIGLTGAKFAPPEKQVPSPASSLTAASIDKEEAAADGAPKPDVKAFIARLESFISRDQLEPNAQSLRKELSSIAGSNSSEQIEALLYFAASLSTQLSHEKNYNAIFGSQLNLLAQANPAGGVIPSMAKGLYDQAKAHYPEVYAAYGFDQWIGFLVKSGLLQLGQNGNWILTNYGRGFLKYVLDRQLTINKPF